MILKKIRLYAILIILAVLLPGTIAAISIEKADARKKFRGHQFGQPYLTLSGGAGLLSKSWQPLATAHPVPFSVSVEYGRTSFPLSIVAGGVTSMFNIDKFLLNPNNFFAGIQYAPLRGRKIAERFNIYCFGALNGSLNRFTEEIYPGIINYEYKVERKIGAGVAAAAGAGYRIGSFEIRPMLFYFTGKAGFLAGHFSEQTFHTGSLQLHFTVAYKMVFDGNKITCPAYRRFKKI